MVLETSLSLKDQRILFIPFSKDGYLLTHLKRVLHMNFIILSQQWLKHNSYIVHWKN